MYAGLEACGRMTWGTFWALIVGGVITAGGGYLESMLSERRSRRQVAKDAAAAKRIEQRDQLVLLIHAGRQWASNLGAVMVGIAVNIPVTMKTEQYKAIHPLAEEYQRQLLTAQLVVDDHTLRLLITELVDHLDDLSTTTSPLAVSALSGKATKAQVDAVTSYIRRAEEMLERLVKAAQAMLSQ